MYKPEYILIGVALLLALAFVQYRSMSGDRLWSANQTVYRERPAAVENCTAGPPGKNDYKVYRALLPSEEASSDSLYSTILITATVPYTHGNEGINDLVGQEWPGSTLARENFTSSATKITALDRDELRDLSLVFATEAEIAEVFVKGVYQGWMALGNASIIRFSRIGFNCEYDQAIVYKSLSCGSLCGADTLYLLEKKDEDWVVLNQLTLEVTESSNP